MEMPILFGMFLWLISKHGLYFELNSLLYNKSVCNMHIFFRLKSFCSIYIDLVNLYCVYLRQCFFDFLSSVRMGHKNVNSSKNFHENNFVFSSTGVDPNFVTLFAARFLFAMFVKLFLNIILYKH